MSQDLPDIQYPPPPSRDTALPGPAADAYNAGHGYQEGYQGSGYTDYDGYYGYYDSGYPGYQYAAGYQEAGPSEKANTAKKATLPEGVEFPPFHRWRFVCPSSPEETQTDPALEKSLAAINFKLFLPDDHTNNLRLLLTYPKQVVEYSCLFSNSIFEKSASSESISPVEKEHTVTLKIARKGSKKWIIVGSASGKTEDYATEKCYHDCVRRLYFTLRATSHIIDLDGLTKWVAAASTDSPHITYLWGPDLEVENMDREMGSTIKSLIKDPNVLAVRIDSFTDFDGANAIVEKYGDQKVKLVVHHTTDQQCLLIIKKSILLLSTENAKCRFSYKFMGSNTKQKKQFEELYRSGRKEEADLIAAEVAEAIATGFSDCDSNVKKTPSAEIKESEAYVPEANLKRPLPDETVIKFIVESISRSYPLNCSSFCHICLEPRHDL
eukprot:sb/3464795/